MAYNATHNNLGRGCLNQSELIALQRDLSAALIEHGHITSKINIPPQNISTQTLTIDWYPGTLAAIKADPAGGKPIGSLNMLYPNRTNGLYSQRDADQASENLKRLSSQGNAKIELQPGTDAGTSTIVYSLEPTPWRKRINGTVGIDNAGSASTGQYQANASLTIDSPLHINDQLTLNYNRNADATHDNHNTKSHGVNWDIATGRFTLGVGYNASSYLQTVPGYQSNLAYTGNSQDFFANLSYMLYRNSNSKTQTSFKIGRKISHSSIDATELPIQMRDYVYTDMGLSHTRYHKDQQYTIALNLRQNLPALSKSVGFIYGEPNWNNKWSVYTLNATASIPFQLKQSHWKYSASLKAQRAGRPTPNSELFSLGSRYTVRGFNETFSISGEDGIQIRNELAYLYGKDQRQQVYLGLDWGKIKGPATDNAIATQLMGSAIGVRGNYHSVNYDVAIGMPIKGPEHIAHKHKPSVYGTLSYQF